MRTDELGRLTTQAKRFATNRPQDKALLSVVTALLSEAGEGDATTVMAALSAATEAYRGRRAPTLPERERAAWEQVGAHFDVDAIPTVEASSAAAYADLVQRSVVGDGAVAELLAVDRSRISQRVSDRSLYAFVGGAEERCFPRWQFAGPRTLPGLKVALASLDPEAHPLTVDHWFTAPNLELEVGGQPVSPITWLATGGNPKTIAELVREL